MSDYKLKNRFAKFYKQFNFRFVNFDQMILILIHQQQDHDINHRFQIISKIFKYAFQNRMLSFTSRDSSRSEMKHFVDVATYETLTIIDDVN